MKLIKSWSTTHNGIECMLTVTRENIRGIDCYLFEHFEDGERTNGTIHNDEQDAVRKFETIQALYRVL